MSEPVLEICRLAKTFYAKKRLLGGRSVVAKAVDGVDLKLYAGETLGLVGESGCGKSTLGRLILRIIKPTAGSVRFRVGDRTHELTAMRGSALRTIRRHIQMIFQDPYTSLNPRHRVYDIIGEPLRALTDHTPPQIQERVYRLADAVGLDVNQLERFPHAFSGGQRQRIGIARALATEPQLIVCDEPVSALDVSVQAQIINMLAELQDRFDLTYLFIAHDLAVVRNISTRVAVMYAGRIIELGPTQDIFEHPRHPYTAALLNAIPVPDPGMKQTWSALAATSEETVSPHPRGCSYATHCSHARDICRQEVPLLKGIGTADDPHQAACHFSDTIQLSIKNVKTTGSI